MAIDEGQVCAILEDAYNKINKVRDKLYKIAYTTNDYEDFLIAGYMDGLTIGMHSYASRKCPNLKLPYPEG